MSDVHDPVGRLRGLDLNLLVALSALLEVGSVTAAAAQVGVTQSAMSHTLRRLRGLFDDALLVRAGAGMAPTPRAAALREPLRAALSGLARALDAGQDFEPATTERVFRMASPDVFDALVLPTLLARFAARAPRAGLVVAPGLDDLRARLATGALDVAVVPRLLTAAEAADDFGPTLADALRTRRLLVDHFRVFVRVGHPLAGPLDAGTFAALDHLLVSPTGRGEGVVDVALAARGLRRRVVLRVPDFGTALAVVADTDLVLTAPGALQHRAARRGLRTLDVDLDLPRHAVGLVWHPRFDADAGHRWFRAQLVEAARGLGG